jgi:hypothetical protein
VNFRIGKHHGMREERGIVPIATPRFFRLPRNLVGYDPFMKKAILLFAAAFTLYTSSPCCLAQDVPAIYLSPSEAAKAKQAVQDFKSAGERNNRAITAWRSFQQGYQVAHAELPNLQFTSDFQIAFTRKNLNTQFPWEAEAVTMRTLA